MFASDSRGHVRRVRRVPGGAPLLAAVGITLALLPLAASAAEWNVALLPPSGEQRLPSDPLQLDLGGVPADALASLYVLLDDVDVTGFAVVEGDLATLGFDFPLSPGPHRLSLVYVEADNTTSVRGEWTFSIEQTRHFESGRVSADATQNAWVRVDEGDTSHLPHRVSGDGGTQVEGEIGRDGWRLEGSAPLLWDTQEETYQGDTGTVGDWIVRGSKGPGTVALGHQDVGTTDLVMDGFSRRGASLELQVERLRSSVTGFSLRGAPVVGFHDGLGLADEENRVSGVLATSRVLDSAGSTFDLSGVWLTGESPDGGSALSGLVGDLGILDGSAWEIQGTVTLLERRIEAAGSFARSHADYGGGTEERSDDAYAIELAVEPFPGASIREFPVSWRTTLDHSQIGTDFVSLANGRLQPDRRTTALRSELRWAGLALTAFGGRIEDNVHARDTLPRMRERGWGIDASYSPAEILGGERPGLLRWLGMPTVSGGYRYDRLEPRRVPATFNLAAVLADNRTDTGHASVTFAYDAWSWSADYLIIDFDDFTVDGVPSTLQQVGVRADVMLGDVLLGGYVQYDLNDLSGSPDRDNVLAGMNLSAPLFRDVVVFTGDVSVSHGHTSDDSEDQVGIVASGAIDWRAIEPTEWRPGLTLSCLGSYQGMRDDVMNELEADAFQLYVRATLYWPLAWGPL